MYKQPLLQHSLMLRNASLRLGTPSCRFLSGTSTGGCKASIESLHTSLTEPELPASLYKPSPQSTAPTWQSTRPSLNVFEAAKTLPPNHQARIGNLQTFALPGNVTRSADHCALGKALVEAWRKDGILQIEIPAVLKTLSDAIKQSKAFFAQKHDDKAKCVDSQSFAGYIASGEEITDGIADYSEIFTVTKDLKDTDPRVQAKWPCHGPTPWPEQLPSYAAAINRLMEYQGQVGEKLLRLIALGLGLRDMNAFNKLTQDGWHHMRVLRFPPTSATNGKGKAGRGVGAHTDYGLLVIASQDEVGGLFIRPPYQDEKYSNWKNSAAGKHETDNKWVYVPPVENVFTVFPGDMMQFMTSSYLPSTPHKVGLNVRERFAFAYFHEPNFNAVCRRLPEFANGNGREDEDEGEEVHYGTHFTNMFMRNYPERITATRMKEERRMDLLEDMRNEYGFSFDH